jgi:hypothetical protein
MLIMCKGVRTYWRIESAPWVCSKFWEFRAVASKICGIFLSGHLMTGLVERALLKRSFDDNQPCLQIGGKHHQRTCSFEASWFLDLHLNNISKFRGVGCILLRYNNKYYFLLISKFALQISNEHSLQGTWKGRMVGKGWFAF